MVSFLDIAHLQHSLSLLDTVQSPPTQETWEHMHKSKTLTTNLSLYVLLGLT
jgi:hypothetical protein